MSIIGLDILRRELEAGRVGRNEFLIYVRTNELKIRLQASSYPEIVSAQNKIRSCFVTAICVHGSDLTRLSIICSKWYGAILYKMQEMTGL